jgi:hypothetical protein
MAGSGKIPFVRWCEVFNVGFMLTSHLRTHAVGLGAQSVDCVPVQHVLAQLPNHTVFDLDIVEMWLYAAHRQASSDLLEKRRPSLNTSQGSRQKCLTEQQLVLPR